MKELTGGAFPRCCVGGMVTIGVVDITEWAAGIAGVIGCEVVVLVPIVPWVGWLVGRLVPHRLCEGVPNVLLTLNNVGTASHYETPLTLLLIQQVSTNNSLTLGKASFTLVNIPLTLEALQSG